MDAHVPTPRNNDDGDSDDCLTMHQERFLMNGRGDALPGKATREQSC